MPRGEKPKDAFYCPGGHRLPREGCTVMYCLDQRAGVSGRGGKRASKQATARREAAQKALASPLKDLGTVPPTQPSNTRTDALPLAEQMEGRATEAGKLALMAGKHAARRGLLPVPDLKGGEAEEYAQRKLVDLLPQAVTELEQQLTYGDDKQRIEAARDVLDANGMRRREQVGNMVPPIVLNFTGVLPWMQVPGVSPETAKKVKANAQIVDGEASRSKDGESGTDGDRPRGSAQADGRGGQAR